MLVDSVEINFLMCGRVKKPYVKIYLHRWHYYDLRRIKVNSSKMVSRTPILPSL
jgi:hypothetical protein